MKPEHAACTSKLPMLRMPTMSQTRFAVDGKHEVRRRGGADQEVDLAGRGAGLLQQARAPPRAPICEVPSPLPLRMWRSLMPVRSTIQASLVSTICGELGIGEHVGGQ